VSSPALSAASASAASAPAPLPSSSPSSHNGSQAMQTDEPPRMQLD
jgi:hypothetical protein